MHVGFERVNFNEGVGLIHKFDGRPLSNDLQKFITQDPGDRFGQTIPRSKGNLMRKTMEYVSRDEFGHNYPIN
jgi:hypothetical protein